MITTCQTEVLLVVELLQVAITRSYVGHKSLSSSPLNAIEATPKWPPSTST